MPMLARRSVIRFGLSLMLDLMGGSMRKLGVGTGIWDSIGTVFGVELRGLRWSLEYDR